MDDTISRQAAIDAVLKLTYADGAYGYADAKELVDSLEALPSAHQLYDEAWRKKHYEASYSQGYVDGYKMCEARMKEGDPHE